MTEAQFYGDFDFCCVWSRDEVTGAKLAGDFDPRWFQSREEVTEAEFSGDFSGTHVVLPVFCTVGGVRHQFACAMFSFHLDTDHWILSHVSLSTDKHNDSSWTWSRCRVLHRVILEA